MAKLYTASPMKVNFPKLKGKDAVESVLGKKGGKIIDMANTPGKFSPEIYDILDDFESMLVNECESICKDVAEAITNIYNDDWVRTRFLTGNLRGSIDVVGNFPVNAVVELDMDKFLEPKKLPALKELKTTTTWYRKKKGEWVSKEYVKYKPGDMVNITGYDYTTPLDYAIFEAIADKYMKKVGA